MVNDERTNQNINHAINYFTSNKSNLKHYLKTYENKWMH